MVGPRLLHHVGPLSPVARWRGPLAGLATVLVVTVPTMVLAEVWQGKPLIDHPSRWWLLPAAIAVVAFAAGGAVGARGRASTGRALVAGLAVAVPAVLVLLAGDAVRRAVYNPTLPAAVVGYLVEASAVALAASSIGAVASAAAARQAPAGSRDDRPRR